MATINNLTPIRFVGNNSIVYHLTGKQINQEFKVTDGVRITAYISGIAFLNKGLKKDLKQNGIKLSKEKVQAMIDKYDLPNILDKSLFGKSRQMIAQSNNEDTSVLKKIKGYTKEFYNSRPSVVAKMSEVASVQETPKKGRKKKEVAVQETLPF